MCLSAHAFQWIHRFLTVFMTGARDMQGLSSSVCSSHGCRWNICLMIELDWLPPQGRCERSQFVSQLQMGQKRPSGRRHLARTFEGNNASRPVWIDAPMIQRSASIDQGGWNTQHQPNISPPWSAPLLRVLLVVLSSTTCDQQSAPSADLLPCEFVILRPAGQLQLPWPYRLGPRRDKPYLQSWGRELLTWRRSHGMCECADSGGGVG